MLNEDDKLDALKTQIFRELLTFMLQDPCTIEPALDLILVSRHLERIGDHATNVAEDVIFMVSARDVRHHAPEADLQTNCSRALESRLRPDHRRAIGRFSSALESSISQSRSPRPRLPVPAAAHRMAGCRPSPERCARTAAGAPVDPAWRPFCSERCKLLDLARWVDGEYRIPGEPVASDSDDPDEPARPSPDSRRDACHPHA